MRKRTKWSHVGWAILVAFSWAELDDEQVCKTIHELHASLLILFRHQDYICLARRLPEYSNNFFPSLTFSFSALNAFTTFLYTRLYITQHTLSKNHVSIILHYIPGFVLSERYATGLRRALCRWLSMSNSNPCISLRPLSLQVVRPLQGSVCRANKPCTVTWLDDGRTPLLDRIGVSTVGLYRGNQVCRCTHVIASWLTTRCVATYTDDPTRQCE